MIGLLAPHHRDLAERVREEIAPFDLTVSADRGEVMRALAEMGALGQLVPAAFGGERPQVELAPLCAIRYELAYRNPAIDAIFAAEAYGSHPLVEHAEERLQQTLLPRVVRGAVTFGFALAETGRGDPTAIATTATRERDQYVIRGTKSLFVNGAHATHFAVFARTGTGERALSAFVVPANMPGMKLAPRDSLSDHPFVDLVFDGCRVPVENRLGPEGEGRKIALATLDFFRCTDAAASLGIAQRAQEAAIEYSYARVHRGAPFDALGPLHALLAENAAELQAAALLVQRGSQRNDGHGRGVAEGALAKLFAASTATRIVGRAVQIQGDAGLQVGTISERRYRALHRPRNEDPAELHRAVIAHYFAPAH